MSISVKAIDLGKSHIEYHKQPVVYFERIWREKLNTEVAVEVKMQEVTSCELRNKENYDTTIC